MKKKYRCPYCHSFEILFSDLGTKTKAICATCGLSSPYLKSKEQACKELKRIKFLVAHDSELENIPWNGEQDAR